MRTDFSPRDDARGDLAWRLVRWVAGMASVLLRRALVAERERGQKWAK
jgi:hypothetical protein